MYYKLLLAYVYFRIDLTLFIYINKPIDLFGPLSTPYEITNGFDVLGIVSTVPFINDIFVY